jgi:ribosomal protein S17
MKNTIPTLILALLLFSGCLNTPEENTPQEEAICKIHYLNCNKLAMESNMSLNEYHKWQEEQKKAAKDEDNATDENGDIVSSEEIKQQKSICKIHHLNCNKLAKEANMSLNEYHKWQEEQEKAAQDEDDATDENGDIVDPEETR